jgi:hypothetical protein
MRASNPNLIQRLRATPDEGWCGQCTDLAAEAADELEHISSVLVDKYRQIERLTRELDEQCRLNGKGSEREAKLLAQVQTLTRERDAAEARIRRWQDDIAREALSPAKDTGVVYRTTDSPPSVTMTVPVSVAADETDERRAAAKTLAYHGDPHCATCACFPEKTGGSR